jgi:hypothetical protein
MIRYVVACELVYNVPYFGKMPQSVHSDSVGMWERWRWDRWRW